MTRPIRSLLRARIMMAIDYGQQPIIPIMVDDAYFFPPSIRYERMRVERPIRRMPFVRRSKWRSFGFSSTIFFSRSSTIYCFAITTP